MNLNQNFLTKVYPMKKSTFRRAGLPLTLLLFVSVTTGCNYYQITDPSNGQVYYTTQKKVYKYSGSTSFKDALTGEEVTLTGHRVKKLSGDEYKQAIAAKREQ